MSRSNAQLFSAVCSFRLTAHHERGMRHKRVKSEAEIAQWRGELRAGCVGKLTEGLEVLDFCGHKRLCFREPAKTGWIEGEFDVANENRCVWTLVEWRGRKLKVLRGGGARDFGLRVARHSLVLAALVAEYRQS